MPETKQQEGIRVRRDFTRQDILAHEATILNDMASSAANRTTDIVHVLKNHLKKTQRLREKVSEYDNGWSEAATTALSKEEYQAEYTAMQSYQDKLDNFQTLLENRIEVVEGSRKNKGDLHDLLSKVLQQQVVKSEMNESIIGTQGAGAGTSGSGIGGVGALLERLVAVQEQQTQALPAIRVRRFGGDVTQFIGFWEEFETVVHNRAHLTDVQRFKYLRDNLDGEAGKSLAGIPPTADNYPKAIRYLMKRYGCLEDIIIGVFTNMMSIPKVQKVSDVGRLKDILDKLNSCILTLETMKFDAKYYAGVFYPVLLRALPDSLIYRYLSSVEDSHDVESIDPNTPLPSLKATSNLPEKLSSRFTELRTFLAKEVATREHQARINHLPGGDKGHKGGPGGSSSSSFLHPGQGSFTKKDDRDKQSSNIKAGDKGGKTDGRNNNKGNKIMRNRKPCIFCGGAHYHVVCKEKLSIDERVAKLDAGGYCRRCLRLGHKTDQCSVSVSCHKCNAQTHMQILCTSSVNQTYVGSGDSLLPTGHVYLRGNNNNESLVRFILDSGSQRTYITSKYADSLKLQPEGHEWLYVHVFGGNRGQLEKFPVVSFAAVMRSGQTMSFTALVTSKISDRILPAVQDHVDKLPNIDLAEQVAGPGELGFLLNASDMMRVLIGGPVTHSCQEDLTLLPTKFGCVAVASTIPSANPANMISTSISLEDFWKLEHVGIQQSELQIEKPDFQQLTEDFKKSIVQDKTKGRYSCKINFDSKKLAQLGDNMSVAKKQAYSLFKRLRADPALSSAYATEINVFLENGFAEPLPSGEEATYVFPHFPVLNPSKQSYKVRPVFNASSHAKGQISLNDCILDVNNLLPTSVEILLKFRSHRIGLAGDITKAYLMVGVHPEFRNTMCFLWARDEQLRNLELFRMTTNTFGVKDAQYNVITVLREHALSFQNRYPGAAKVLCEDLYMDDMLTGSDTLEGALQLKEQVSTILGDADMIMKKWRISHSKEETSSEQPLAIPNGADKVLGIVWLEKDDVLTFKGKELFEFAQKAAPTKRTLMGAVARLHDPVGLVSPFVMLVKLLLQECHIRKLTLDETLPKDLLKGWLKWCDELNDLDSFSLPRCYTAGLGIILKQELHGFADASDRAYGGVVYLKSVDSAGNVEIAFVASKARLAPIKTLDQLTIPKKELVAALCTARLVDYVASHLKLENLKTFLWSDSMTVLHWIHGETPEKHGVFVRNRLVEILKLSTAKQWAHVEGIINPADLPSRGCDMAKLSTSDLWKKGPAFLKNGDSYPRFKNENVAVATLHAATSEQVFDITRFSTLSKAVRAYATIMRCMNRFRSKGCRGGTLNPLMPTEKLDVLPLQGGELDAARSALIKQAQHRCFGETILQLEKGEACDDPHISSFHTFIGEEGLLRVGGRLESADEPYGVRHPILLSDDHLTRLIIEDVHIKGVRHLKTDVVLTNLRQFFWIIRSRQLVKSVIYKCSSCRRYSSKAGGAIEAPLPQSRIDGFTTPFKHIGVDYLGPFVVRMEKKTSKMWVALFTCSVTRALHLEVVNELTGAACVDAFKRFISCRGTPSSVNSDNGLNFVRTERAFRSLWGSLKSNELQNFFGTSGIEWVFNAPRAAWWGGQFERLVRVVKDCVKHSVKSHVLPFFEFLTLMKEIEAVVNSRPLTTIPCAPDDPVPLTPAHFVASRIPITLPSGQVSSSGERGSYLVQMWRAREKTLNKFWRRWRNEYLLYLRSGHQRKGSDAPPLKEGDVVIIQQDNLPRTLWRLGRINRLISGRDGTPRSCEVQTSSGTLRRAVQHLYKLL